MESHSAGFPPFHTPWKSLPGFPHYHGYGDDYHVSEDRQSPPKSRNQSHSHRKGLVNHVPGLKRKGCPGTLNCHAGFGCDFEITEALFNRAFTSEIAGFVLIYRDVHLVPQSLEIVRFEAHGWIHAVIEQNVQQIHVNASELIHRRGRCCRMGLLRAFVAV
jgi:hypothetical protein